MARQARLAVPGFAHHLLIRGNNRQPIFADDQDRRSFLGQLQSVLRENPLALHAYVLMPNHVHLLVTPGTAEAMGRAIQSLGRRYVAAFNARHGRTGTLWEGRYRAHLVEGSNDLLSCMRFIELNPQRSGLASELHDPAWSSLAHHLGASRDPLVTEPAAYWSLGNTPFEREAAYRDWVEQGASTHEVSTFAKALVSGRPVGSPPFVSQIERLTSRSLTPRPRGRPRRSANAVE